MSVEPELIHSVHIPVMGTSFTIDSPIKVARFGISSVMSIGDDELCEYMRKHYCGVYQEPYEEIKKWSENYRPKRITEYLNLVDRIVKQQFQALKALPFEVGNDLSKYFELLPEKSPLKQAYQTMLSLPEGPEKQDVQASLRQRMRPGSLDVNIMTKIDRIATKKDGTPLPIEESDALTALQGFAESTLQASIVFSAGFNRHLYAAIEKYPDFFPDASGFLKKKVILKVSDYRSSLTQGKFLAKKGVWVSEHRIESGLNCGGHVFPSEGYLLGPILEEFKQQRAALTAQLWEVCNTVLKEKNRPPFTKMPYTRITVQGGIGTAKEQNFLLNYYGVDGTGWATPFLLVPEVTTVDEETRLLLAQTTREELYTSSISPLGVRFNTFKTSKSEALKRQRVLDGKPGSPCPKGFLISNTEFTQVPICTASTLYQRKKIEQLKSLTMSQDAYDKAFQKVVDKACLCEDLAAGALLETQQTNKRALAPAVCPGPNLAYFSRIFTLAEMVGHIYGRINILNDTPRPNLFMTELGMYIDFLSMEIKDSSELSTRQIDYFKAFRKNLEEGMYYYKTLIPAMIQETQAYQQSALADLETHRARLEKLVAEHPSIFQ